MLCYNNVSNDTIVKWEANKSNIGKFEKLSDKITILSENAEKDAAVKGIPGFRECRPRVYGYI